MARTRENEEGRCPLCGELLSKDSSGRGYVRHLALPRGSFIFDDKEKTDRMLSSGDLSPDYLEHFNKTGYCPYQRGQRD